MVLNQQIMNWIDLQSTERFTILMYKKIIHFCMTAIKSKKFFQSNADIVIYNEKQ